jgi:hypothetical protein
MQKLEDKYNIELGNSVLNYEFISVGKKGEITKIVQYIPMDVQGFFNLAFGDRNEFGELDDMAISDNGDSQKVLATVASTLYTFTDKYPDAFIFATGSTDVRTRLYRIGISNNQDEIERDFVIFGILDGNWQVFEPNKPYEGFLVKRKIIK